MTSCISLVKQGAITTLSGRDVQSRYNLGELGMVGGQHCNPTFYRDLPIKDNFREEF